jgi:integral membrane protein
VPSVIRQLVWIGRLEGASFLLLLGVAMPLKYLAGQPLAVRVVGMAHGVLFLLFLAALARAAHHHGWPRRRVVAGVVASLVPFGPFWFERQLARAPDPGRCLD